MIFQQGIDPKMFKTVANLKVPYILMHMKGNPRNMMENSNYSDLTMKYVNIWKKLKKQELKESMI